MRAGRRHCQPHGHAPELRRLNPTLTAAANAFLLAFPALLSIVNPVSSAFIFRAVTSGFTHTDRLRLTRRVALYSFAVMLVSMLGGSYVLQLFGISLGALRVGGGFVVAANAWALLSAPETREARKQEQAEPSGDADQMAFFPLTMPFTTGPGTIAVAVSLGSQHPVGSAPVVLAFNAGLIGAAAAMALLIWLVFGAAERVGDRIGPVASRSITRLLAFLLLCIGVQILINGIEEVVRTYPAG